MPKISVITPVYNCEKYLTQAIDSILNQTFTDFEFIIINDGSTDGSLAIIESYCQKDSRIKLINNLENLGFVRPLNQGLKSAQGKYIARFDGDDISLPTRLEKQFTFLEDNQDIFLIGGQGIVIDEDGIELTKISCPIQVDDVKRTLLKNNCLIHPSIMFRNKNVFYREKFKAAEDYDLYLRLLSAGYKISNLSEVLVKYRQRSDSIIGLLGHSAQVFGAKANTFYWQRVKNGTDDYDQFNYHKILSQNITNNEVVFLKAKMLYYLRAGLNQKAKNVFNYLSKGNQISSIKLFGYYLAIRFPKLYKFYRKMFFNDCNI